MDFQAIAEVVLLPIVAGLLGWRGGSKVKADNARDALVSRHDGNLLDERNRAVAELDKMRDDRDAERTMRAQDRALITLLQDKVKRRDVRIVSLESALQEYAEEQFKQASRWMPRETTLGDIDDLPLPAVRKLPPPRDR